VCSPALLRAHGLHRRARAAADIAGLPLLQQSTRPDVWHQWFEAQRLQVPLSRRGARYELFSMLAAAAVHGLGVALVPRMLVEGELAQGQLVIACERPLQGQRGYYLVVPERAEERPLLAAFSGWLLAQARG